MREYKTLDTVLLSRGLPKYSLLFIVLFVSAWAGVAVRQLFDLNSSTETFLSGERLLSGSELTAAIERKLILSQLALPWYCLFPLVSCLIRKPRWYWRIGVGVSVLILAFNIFQIGLNFGIHLVNGTNANTFHFLARFVGLTLYVYFAFLTGAVCRMKKISKRSWKVFEIIMLLLALFAFAGTVLQKATGDLEIVTASAVIAGTIAFALKFAKMTCEFNAEENLEADVENFNIAFQKQSKANASTSIVEHSPQD